MNVPYSSNNSSPASNIAGELQTLLPLGSNSLYAENSADDRYIRVMRQSNGTIEGFSPSLNLESLQNVSFHASSNQHLPTNVPGFLVWAGTMGINQYIQWDFFTLYPHSFTPHTAQQVGDILVYRGGYTSPLQNNNNYHWTQPSFSGAAITSGTINAARLPDTYATQGQLVALEARVTALGG